jgi:quaternary ammonium compound-resistance protein SugE
MNPWLMLVVSGLLEICFTTAMKLSDGFRKALPTLAFLVLAPVSLWLLSNVLRQIPVGTAYAVWTGIGAVGTALVGIFFFKESASRSRLAMLALLVISIIGLRLTSGGE